MRGREEREREGVRNEGDREEEEGRLTGKGKEERRRKGVVREKALQSQLVHKHL